MVIKDPDRMKDTPVHRAKVGMPKLLKMEEEIVKGVMKELLKADTPEWRGSEAQLYHDWNMHDLRHNRPLHTSSNAIGPYRRRKENAAARMRHSNWIKTNADLIRSQGFNPDKVHSQSMAAYDKEDQSIGELRPITRGTYAGMHTPHADWAKGVK